MANTYLQRTNQTADWIQNFSISIWFKKSKTGDAQYIYSNYQDANNRAYINILNDDRIYIYDREGGYDRQEMTSNFKLTDTNAWYHIFFWCHARGGGSGGSLNDRVKFYVNGVDRINDFSIALPYGYNADSGFQTGTLSNGNKIGSDPNGNNTFDGSMSHIHFLDNQPTYDVDSFGETDATTGEWKIKTDVSVNYGTNGFFILKDGNSVTDQSGNSNNFTVGGGTLTKTEDSPSNVFCTLSPLHKLGTNTGTYSNGNTKYADANSNWQGTMCTLGATSGKYYWEYQLVGGTYHMVGVMPDNVSLTSSSVFDTIGGYSAYIDNGTIEARYNNADISGWSSSQLGNTTFSANDYINLAVDMDNKFMYIGKNGTWFKSGDPTSGSTGTGGINISATFTSGVFMIPVISAYSGTTGQFNFGNGYMGTTAVSSAGTNASGNGIFEYDVPTGYTALSTKGLNL